MTAPFTVRQTGLAAIVAATLIVVSQASQLLLPLVITEATWIAIQSIRMGLALVATFSLLIALTALYSMHAQALGRLGLVGYLTAAFGTMLVAGNWWYEAFIGPMLRAEAPELLATAPSGTILIGAGITGATFAVGWAMLGVATLRARVFPRGAAVLLTIGGVVGFLAAIAPFQIPIAIAVAWMGTTLLRTARGPIHAEAPAGGAA